MRSLFLLKLFLIFSFFQTTGCKTKSVTFVTEGPGSVSLLSWDKLGSEGVSVGKTPVTIEMDKVGDNVVMVRAPEKTPQYWVFTEMHGEQFTAKITLSALPERQATGEASEITDINESYRLLMKSYQALASKKCSLAKTIAKKLSEIKPRLASPLIISGLASLEQGNNEEALAAFSKAKSLDPKDADIDKLLKAVK